jgi:thymidylate synthase (FAD)
MECFRVENWGPKVKLISITPKAEEIIEKAYRNCWRSEPKKLGEEARREFIEKCIRRGHLSPLEFAFATFEIVGSRAYTHQQVRHRIASYAQESQRYVKVDDPNYIVIPPKIQDNSKALEIFFEAIKNAWSAYQALLELGIKKEDARYVLPNACKSKIFVGMNFRAWRHFIKLRCDVSAQWEIREVATKILKILYNEAPSVFADLYRKFVIEREGKKELWTQWD